MPSFFVDCCLSWNPLISAFPSNVIPLDDKSHVLKPPGMLGLRHGLFHRMIPLAILNQYGASQMNLKKEDILFKEGREALNYFQILSGSIKLITTSVGGQEFIQGIFKEEDSFGEPPLFCSFPYPSTAVALEPLTVLKLSKERFLLLLKENFDLHLQLDRILCLRLKYKSMILSEISSYDPEHRITSLLNFIKQDSERHRTDKNGMFGSSEVYFVPFTRQQIADMSGLRVETVIRTVKRMEANGKLKLLGRKISF